MFQNHSLCQKHNSDPKMLPQSSTIISPAWLSLPYTHVMTPFCFYLNAFFYLKIRKFQSTPLMILINSAEISLKVILPITFGLKVHMFR